MFFLFHHKLSYADVKMDESELDSILDSHDWVSDHMFQR
jgi:hypothetical protein